jgi:hypothetical protein
MKSNPRAAIKRLNKKLSRTSADVSAIRQAIQAQYNILFSACPTWTALITKLESSDEYGSDEGGIYHWVRAYGMTDDKAEREYLAAWLSEYHCVYADFANDALKAHDGGCLIINEDGDVYDEDSGKRIVDRADYLDEEGEEDEELRNALIEAWMERTGYFPGVFTHDRHGNVFPVSTLKKEGVA